jgi:Na+-translocating ferredoxin:NAD+ oxidoreductase RnfG subunit
MCKKLISFTFVVTIIACLSLLAFVTGCVESNNSFGGGMKAVRRVFPSATDTAEISRGVQVSGRPDDAIISEIKGDLSLLGYCVESTVVSRSGPFRIRVLLDKQFYVKQASVISYPWDRGRDVRKHAFTGQFEGKGPEDPIQLGKDIDAMTGATISSRVMTDGVRRAVKIVSALAE